MNVKRITALVPVDLIDSLEAHLRASSVPGVTVETVHGYGEHPNFFRRDLMRDNARVILYTDASGVDEIVAAIQACADECDAKAGILVVEDIERLVNLTHHTEEAA